MNNNSIESLTVNKSGVSSVPDINRQYYVNNEGFSESIITNKLEQSKVLSIIPSDIDFKHSRGPPSSPYPTIINLIISEVRSSRARTASTQPSRPSTSYTTYTSVSIDLNSPDLSKDMFTPTTYKALDSEIQRNSDNISSLNKTTSDEGVRQSVHDKLMDEGRYLLEQKSKHLPASVQTAKNTSIDDVDPDNLDKEISLLKQRTDSVYKKSMKNSYRLEEIKEDLLCYKK